jgi:fructose-1,6-bisphosphatase III
VADNGAVHDLTLLQALAAQYRTADAAVSEIASLRSGLSLPKGVIHIVSDVHGEYKKLRHVINNASGSLRTLVESLFESQLSPDQLRQLLAVLYYPQEMIQQLHAELSSPEWRRAWAREILRRQFQIARELARRYPRQYVRGLIPELYRELFAALMNETSSGPGARYTDAMIDALAVYDRDLSAIRAASRLVRNLSVSEIIVAGDLGDRGPRMDMVIDYLMQQPRVSFTWGNHDASWMGACLGQEALIATVLRIALRYRRLSQLEEGYGLIVSPLENLARTVYANDPAEYFMTRGMGLRDDLLMARMQKVAAIMQFKLEGQIARRHPDWKLEEHQYLHRIDRVAGTVEVGGKTYKMRDMYLPTVNWDDPYALSEEERTCMNRLRQSFLTSRHLWEHMSYVVKHGAMSLIRDETVIFHGCVPVDGAGAFLSFKINGVECAGRAMFKAFESFIHRAFRKGADDVGDEADYFWYLWSGPSSPLFGKDKMATFETYFIEDEETHKETKNPYFQMIHDAGFCARVASELGADPDALIVNGHMPVRVEKGEEPVKRGGHAVTIDGAFSEAYGDRGYTLISEPDRIALAEHHHFESIEEAIVAGADIVPKVTNVRTYAQARLVKDTEEGEAILQRIDALERLVAAYEDGVLPEKA